MRASARLPAACAPSTISCASCGPSAPCSRSIQTTSNGSASNSAVVAPGSVSTVPTSGGRRMGMTEI
jgi:hypothetical protein